MLVDLLNKFVKIFGWRLEILIGSRFLPLVRYARAQKDLRSFA